MGGMKIVLLGAAGFIGRIAASFLSARPEVRELLLVDYNIRDAKRFAKSLSPKCRWAMADVGRSPELARVLDGVDAVASAVGPCSEYEKGVLLTCGERGVSAASIGDGTLSEEERREIHDSFRRKGAAAVSGCGMMPGWTELLSAHRLRGEVKPRRYLFCSLDRFGGYAFLRRVAKETGGDVPPPPGAPPGCYFRMGEDLFGLPAGNLTGLSRRLVAGGHRTGPVRRELSAAFLFWLRRSFADREGAPAAAAGVWGERENGGGVTASIVDPGGRLAGLLLAEAALHLAVAKQEKGLLPLPALIGREEAEGMASSGGGKMAFAPASSAG